MIVEPRIICTKEDFARLVAACVLKPNCKGCALEEICGVGDICARLAAADRLAEFVEVVADEQSDIDR